MQAIINLVYRPMSSSEAERIREIDAECHIKNAWRIVEGSDRQLVEINWTDHELPNGIDWHIERFKKSLDNDGIAIGCFDGDILVGYTVINAEVFGSLSKYVLLDQIFVSKTYRGKSIGKKLFAHACAAARNLGADKLYICAGSSEDTIAYYFKLGCIDAQEIDPALAAEDPNDWQLEFKL